MVFRFLVFAALAAVSVLGVHPILVPEVCEVEHVCYIIDQSGSIDGSEYAKEQNFVVRISNEIEDASSFDPSNSAVAFSNNAAIIQEPITDLAEFHRKVNENRRYNGGTVISNGLTQCKDLLQSKEGTKVMVLITDGMTIHSDEQPSKTRATEAKADGIKIVTVGIRDSQNNGVSEDFLREIASHPSLYIDAEFDNLDQRIPEVVESICTPIEDDNCKKAFNACDFKFSGHPGLATFAFTGEPDHSFTTRVIPKDVSYSLGTLNTNSMPEFLDVGGNNEFGARDITEFGSQRFTSTHFKPYWIMQERASGIGHQTFHGNQESIAKDKCVRVYFTQYQEVRENRIENRNNVPRSQNKCVVFRTAA